MSKHELWRSIVGNRLAIVLFLLLTLLGPPVPALYGQALPDAVEAVGYDVSAEMDWENGRLLVEITSPIQASSRRRPTAPYETERRIDEAADELILDELLPLQYDHQRTLADVLERDVSLFADLRAAVSAREKLSVIQSRNLQELTVAYAVPVVPELTTRLVSYDTPLPLPRRLVWTPTTSFSGLVIYVPQQLEVRGAGTSALQPALFPRILDEGLKVLFERGTMLPEAFANGGSIVYVEEFGDPAVERRAGPAPLRVIARELFGIEPADIIISDGDAATLLYSPSAAHILRNGRIVVVAPRPN